MPAHLWTPARPFHEMNDTFLILLAFLFPSVLPKRLMVRDCKSELARTIISTHACVREMGVGRVPFLLLVVCARRSGRWDGGWVRGWADQRARSTSWLARWPVGESNVAAQQAAMPLQACVSIRTQDAHQTHTSRYADATQTLSRGEATHLSAAVRVSRLDRPWARHAFGHLGAGEGWGWDSGWKMGVG